MPDGRLQTLGFPTTGRGVLDTLISCTGVAGIISGEGKTEAKEENQDSADKHAVIRADKHREPLIQRESSETNACTHSFMYTPRDLHEREAKIRRRDVDTKSRMKRGGRQEETKRPCSLRAPFDSGCYCALCLYRLWATLHHVGSGLKRRGRERARRRTQK